MDDGRAESCPVRELSRLVIDVQPKTDDGICIFFCRWMTLKYENHQGRIFNATMTTVDEPVFKVTSKLKVKVNARDDCALLDGLLYY